jgi:Ulp1 family protease
MQHDIIYVIINHGQCHWTLLVLNTKDKLANYYDSYRQDTPLYWKILCEYFDARCDEQGVERNDWENWNHVAVKVSTPIII